MSSFYFDPYVGALPVKFGMSPKDVSSVIGPPESTSADHATEGDERRGPVVVRYSTDDSKVAEISFLPKAQFFYQGVDLFQQKHLIDFLSQYDRPMEFVGFVVFLGLGLAITGFHDNDESQKAVTAFRRGHWDEFRGQLAPLGRT